MKYDENQLRAAFALGFMASREGYNGECAFEHMAPDDLEPFDEGKDTMETVDDLLDDRRFWRLSQKAIDRMS